MSRAQAHREIVDFKNRFDGSVAIEHFEVATRNIRERLLECLDLLAESRFPRVRIGVQPRCEAIDLSLHRRKARCRGRHDALAHTLDESQHSLQFVRGFQATLAFDDETTPDPVPQSPPRFQRVVITDAKLLFAGMFRR